MFVRRGDVFNVNFGRRVGHEEEGLRPAIVVQADDVHGFAHALEILLTDENLRQEMGENGYHITVPTFTWPDRVTVFLDQIGLGLENSGEHELEPAD